MSRLLRRSEIVMAWCPYCRRDVYLDDVEWPSYDDLPLLAETIVAPAIIDASMSPTATHYAPRSDTTWDTHRWHFEHGEVRRVLSLHVHAEHSWRLE